MARFFATSRASVESSAAAPPSTSSSTSSSSSNGSSNSNTKDACRATASSKTGSNTSSTTTGGSRWSRRPRLRRQHAHDFESVPEKAIAVPAPALSRESLGSGYTEAPSSRGASETLSACSPSEAGLEDFLGDASDDDLSWLEADLSPSCAPPPCEPELEAEVDDSVALSAGGDDDDEAGGALVEEEEEEEEEQLELCEARHSGPLELRVEDFECGECIGKGSYSRVFLGTHVVSGTEWALKVVSKRKTFETRENLAHLREEKNISTKVQGSDFLVRTAGTFQNPRSVVFAMEYLPGGDLYERLSDKGTLPLGEAVAWVAQAVLAIEDLHELNIVHRDIKPENFLMGKSGTLKLTDFGFARQLAPEERLFSQFGTPEYVAPEVLNGCGHGMPVDLWALGVLIYELLVGHTPFKARSVDEMYERIAAGEYAFPAPPSRRSSPSSSSSSKSLQRESSRGKRVSTGKEASRSRGSSNGGGGCDGGGGAPGVYKSTGYRDRAGKGKVRGGGGSSGSSSSSAVDAAQDPSAQALVKSLLCQAPRRRPSIAEIKRHPFFSGVNFDALRAAVRAQADAEEEEAVVAAAMNGGEVWMREQPVVCVSEDVDDNYGGVFAAF